MARSAPLHTLSADTLSVAPVIATPVAADSVVADTAVADSVVKPLRFYEKGIIGKFYNYFRNSNRVAPDNKFDISFIGGPHYSSEEGFGIGVAGSGSYRAGNFSNKNTPRSNVTLKLDVTTGQMYKIAAEGYHIFENDPYRINYDVYFYSFKDKWWGVGYDMNNDDTNECIYKRLQSQATLDFVVKLHPGVFIGPIGQFSYVNARDFNKPELLGDRRDRIFTWGAGLTFFIDTRDIPTGASRGVYLRFDALSHPKWMGNKDPYRLLEVNASAYAPVWRGGILAFNVHSRLTWGSTPWCFLSTRVCCPT